jgi:hypothetical protein
MHSFQLDQNERNKAKIAALAKELKSLSFVVAQVTNYLLHEKLDCEQSLQLLVDPFLFFHPRPSFSQLSNCISFENISPRIRDLFLGSFRIEFL